MAKRVSRFGHSGGVAVTFVGRPREVTVDVGNNSLRVHDGATTGGFETARADAANIQEATTSQAGKMTSAQVVALNDAANKASVNEGNISTNTTNIAINAADIATLTADKANKPGAATADNLAKLTAGGDLADAGISFQNVIPDDYPLVFYKNTAPPGWTIIEAVDGHAVICTKGSVAGGSEGGMVSGTDDPKNISKVPGHTHPFTADPHSHSYTYPGGGGCQSPATGPGCTVFSNVQGQTNQVNVTGITDQNTGASNITMRHALCIVAARNPT